MLLSSKLLSSLYLLIVSFAFLAAYPAHGQNFRNPFRIPLSVDPYGLTTGDLNGDGRNDIVWTERTIGSRPTILHVLLGGGNSQYTPAPDITFSYYPPFIDCIIEDVTGDKRNDLVCVAVATNYMDASVFTYRGNGDGTFATPVQFKISAPVSFPNPILARAGDLNGDGIADVLVMNANYSGILPLLSDGQGSFKAGTFFNGSFNYSVPTVADVNSDGKLDVLWPTGPRVNLGNGDGTFAAPVQYDPGPGSTCAFGDVDHDGHLDASCAWYDNTNLGGRMQFAVLHGNPDGSFNRTPIFTRSFGTGESTYDGYPTILSPVLIADLNGDGYADIVSLSGDGYCVLLGGPNTTWNGQPQEFDAASMQSEGGISGVYGVSIADMNGNGLPDIVAIGPNGLYLTYAQSDGSLSSSPAVEVGEVSSSAALVDVNNDGNLDIVSAGDTALKLSLGHGDGTFSLPTPITTTGNFVYVDHAQSRVISGDFNGDGKQDLLATGTTGPYTTQNYILFGHGDGTFDAPSPITAALGKVFDLNHDGRSDVISISNYSLTPHNLLIASISHGDGSFSTVSTSLPGEVDTVGNAEPAVGPTLADFRHSGNLDAAVASPANAYFVRGHGDGSFDSTGITLAVPELPNLYKIENADIASGDFDGDGNADVAVLTQYDSSIYAVPNPTSAVWVFYGDGNGNFSSAKLAGTFNRKAGTLTAGDLDGDGLADLVLTYYNVYQYTGVLTIHALTNRAWGPESDYTGGEGLSPLWIVDINHDGHNDLIVSNSNRGNYSSNSVSVLLNQQSLNVTGTLAATPEPSVVGSSFSLLATLSSPDGSALAGTVDFLIDGAAVGSASIVNHAAQIFVNGTLPVGRHTLQATWAGNSTFRAVTLTGSHMVVGLPTALTLATSLTPSSAGASVTFSYTLSTSSSAAPPASGSMTLTDNGTPLRTDALTSSTLPYAASLSTATLSAGTHTITANYSGDSNFAASSATLAQIVTTQPVSISLKATPNPARVGQSVQLNIMAASTGCGQCAFTGQVSLLDGSASLGTIQLAIDGTASLTTSFSTAGMHQLTASFAGDTYHQAATAMFTEPVVRSDTALSLTSSLNPSAYGSPIRLTAILTNATINQPISSATIVFTDGSTVLGAAPSDLTGTAALTVSTLAVGSHTIMATYQQTDSLNANATSLIQTVVRAASGITLTGTPNPVYQHAPLTLAAHMSIANGVEPTGRVQFLDGSAVIGSARLSASNAMLITATLSVGIHTIQANYPGDTQVEPSVSSTLNITVLPSDFILTSTPSSVVVQTAHHLTFTVAAQSVGDFADQLQFSTTNLPAHATLRFMPDHVSLTAGGKATTSVYLDTDDVLGYARLSNPLERIHRNVWTLAAAPFLLLGLVRRRRFGQMLILICLGLGSVLLQGCSGHYPASTTPGSYIVQIKVFGLQTGLVHMLNLPVQVTK